MDTVFFIFSKTLTLLAFPLSFSLLFGLFIVWKWGTYGRRKILVLPFLFLWILSTDSFSQCILLPLEDEYPRIDLSAPSENIEKVDVVVVLGGMFNNLTRHPDLPELNSSADRLTGALELYKLGYAKKILFTGGSGSLYYDKVKESDLALDFFHKMGIPTEDIWMEVNSRNTRENALFTKDILKEKGIADKKFYLVTSAFHMGRSMNSFQSIGLHPIPYPVDYKSLHPDAFGFDSWTPKSGALDTTALSWKEWMGRPIYHIYSYFKDKDPED